MRKSTWLLSMQIVALGLCCVVLLAAPGAEVASAPHPHASMSLLSTNPVSNTNTAPASTGISVTYTEEISASTVSTETFAVHASLTGLLTGTYSVEGDTISLHPPQPLKPGELVCTSATTDTLSVGGSRPDDYTVWQFRVAATGGSATFADSGQSLGYYAAYNLQLGDVDRDGDLDAVIANNSYPNEVWLNDGFGTFTNSGQALGNAHSRNVALGDLNGDGYLDIFDANDVGEANVVYLNDGTGHFDPIGSLGTSSSLGVALGDLDGDGDLDAFVAEGGANTVWLNDGTGSFVDTLQSLGGSYSYRVSLGDVDDDGDLDGFVASDGANRVWLNDGHGFFLDSGQTLGNGESTGAELGDLDGDGDLDAFVANYWGDGNTVWFNDGAGNFADSTQRLGDSYEREVALGDLDGDGDLDALTATFWGRTNQVWLNDGSGSFTPGQDVGNMECSGVKLGDLDGDGDLDTFLSLAYGYHQVWLNYSLADLVLSKASSHSNISPGLPITYTLTMTNTGPNPVSGAPLADDVNYDITNVEWGSITKEGSSCDPANGTGNHIASNLDLPASGVVTITITGLVSESPTSPLSNSASIAVPVLVTDTNPANSYATVNTNYHPSAEDDALQVVEETSDNILDVLSNDSFTPDIGETLAIATVGSPDQGGSVTNMTSHLLYTPLPGFRGLETFTYTVSDGNGGTDTGGVTVTVGYYELSIVKTDRMDPWYIQWNLGYD